MCYAMTTRNIKSSLSYCAQSKEDGRYTAGPLFTDLLYWKIIAENLPTAQAMDTKWVTNH